jgi:hypothetical protein
MYQHEFVWENEDNAEVTVCVDFQILEAEPGYQQEIEIQDIQVHIDGIGWGRTDGGTEDEISNHVYDNMQSELIEGALG